MSGNQQPDALARVLGTLLVGLAVAYVVGKIGKAALPGVVVGVIGMVAHEMLDAPVSRKLSEVGF